ncbi:MAG: T9SS type A sorting domain-containing protein, partial [Bacteroidia bacterium]|nr:T9SS type A sorting domain-containing protein [Bacteroidia bacterium]
IGQRQGAGTTQSVTYYSFPDWDVVPNVKYYYRLRQVDFDGTEKLSNIVEAIILKDVPFQATIYPNPTEGNLTLDIAAQQDAEFTFQIYNNLGQVVFEKQIEVKRGVVKLDLDVSSIAAGSYQALIESNGYKSATKLIKMK